MDGAGSARLLTRLWLMLVAVVAIAVLYLAKVLALPLAFAILFAFMLAPVVSAIERIRMPRAIASVLVIVGFATVLGGAGWILFSQLVDVVNDLPTYRGNIQRKMVAMHVPTNSAFARAQKEIEHLGTELGVADATTEADAQNARAKRPLGATPDRPIQVKDVTHRPGRLDGLGGVMEPLTTAFLSVVFTFFVLLQREDLRNRIIRLSGDRNLSMMTQAMTDAGRRISRYFLLQMTVNVIYGGLVFTALYFIGVPHALLFGAIAGVCRFVPYIGPPVAGALPVILSLAVFDGWQKTLMVLGTFVLLEIITANYAEPRIYGKHTGLSSLAILIAAAFWTLIWGPVGLVLSVPLTVCLVVMGRHVPSLEFLTVLLGDEPIIHPWTRFYQRLLAGDAREASEIVEAFVADKPMEDVFDSVLVPALMACEQDRQRDDIDEVSARFVRATASDLIEEIGDRSDALPEGDVRREQGTSTGAIRTVLCIPVRDESDELGARMLARSLDTHGVRAIALPVQHLDQMLEATAKHNPDAVFLTGLPPVGTARPHRLYRTLRARHPHLHIFVGIWSYPGNGDEAARKISGGEERGMCTRIAQAVASVRALNHPAVLAESPAETAQGRNVA